MDAKGLGFKFQPGDKVCFLGSIEEPYVVLACNLILSGQSQEITRSYALKSPYGPQVFFAIEDVLVPASERPSLR
jgi:hypothetical protein